MIRWKSENVLWYIFLVTIIQNGDTTKIRQIGKNFQKNQQSSEQHFFELSDCNRKLDFKDIQCEKNTTTNRCITTTPSCATTTTNPCTTTISCATTTTNPCTTNTSCATTTINPFACVMTEKTTTCNPDKQDSDDDDDDDEDEEDEDDNKKVDEKEDSSLNQLTAYKPVWPKCQDAHCTISEKNCKQTTKTPHTTKCSTKMLTTVKKRVQSTKYTTKIPVAPGSGHKIIRLTKKYKVPQLNVYETTLPPFLEHYITFGTFRRIICPLLKEHHTRYVYKNNNNINNNTSRKLQMLTECKKKYINSNNFRKKLLFSETQQQNVENKSEIDNKNNWLHYLQERLQKGNSEYEDDKPTMKSPIMNVKENWKNPQIQSTNHEDFMQYFLRNNLYNKNNNLHSNIHIYHPKNQDNSLEFNKFNIITKNNHLKSEKRNINKAKNEDKVIPTVEEENNKSNCYDKDMETKKMAKLDNIFRNIIKDINTENNENDLTYNNDTILQNNYDEVQNNNNNENVNLLYTITTKQPSMNTYKSSNNEPNIQILNITQVFNMYSKLIPLKKYIEALHSNKWLTTSEIEKTKNYSDNENDNISWLNQSTEKDFKQCIQYALIKELLKNYIRNATDIDQLNYNGNLYDSNLPSSLQSINKHFNFNPFLLAPKSKKSINSNKKVKTPKIKKLNDNDRIVNAIKDVFKSIANNDENDDLLNIKKLKWNPFYETINQYA